MFDFGLVCWAPLLARPASTTGASFHTLPPGCDEMSVAEVAEYRDNGSKVPGTSLHSPENRTVNSLRVQRVFFFLSLFKALSLMMEESKPDSQNLRPWEDASQQVTGAGRGHFKSTGWPLESPFYPIPTPPHPTPLYSFQPFPGLWLGWLRRSPELLIGLLKEQLKWEFSRCLSCGGRRLCGWCYPELPPCAPQRGTHPA